MFAYLFRCLLIPALLVPIGCSGSLTETDGSPPPQCDAESGQPVTLTSQGQFEMMFEGRWLFCKGDAVLGPAHDQAGIEIMSDHTFFVLHAVDGQVARGSGFDYQGTWREDTAQSINAELWFPAGEVLAEEAFLDAPRKMRIDTEVGVADYVLVP
jgi:hypothetical protein